MVHHPESRCENGCKVQKEKRLSRPANPWNRIGEKQRILSIMETMTVTQVPADRAKDKLKILLVEDDADDYVIIRHHISKIPGNASFPGLGSRLR
jgi:hypothetical protein